MNKEQLKECIGELNLVDTVFEADGVSYIDTAVSVTQVYELIDQLDEPEKPSKPVIPKIVAEQLEYWKRNKMNILWQFFIREIPSSTLSWLESDVGNYDKLIDAENNGYEVEKEKLYYTVDEKGQTLLFKSQAWGILRSNGALLETVLMVHEHKPSNMYQLTEKEIKEYDERYWLFAVEETP